MMLFATVPNLIDILIVVFLILTVPLLVQTYIKGPEISERLAFKVTVLGILWILFGLVSEDLLEALTPFERMDSWGHARIAEMLVLGQDPSFWDTIPTGNRAYQAFLSAIFSLGAHVPGARALNAYFGLWGGLVIAGRLKPFLAAHQRRELMILVVIFFPSTVFWTSNNLKEGLAYWGVCMIFASAFPAVVRGAGWTISSIMGTVAAGFMRPHVCLACLVSVSLMTFLRKRRMFLAVLTLFAVPLLFVKMQDLAQNELSSLDEVTAYMETQRRGLIGTGGGSTHREGGGIPIISGLLNLFFRPFPWESRSLFMFISAVEIWSLTCTMFVAWFKLTARERRIVLKHPAVRSSLMFCGLISILFSFLPNDGLLARQRVQAIPALMILVMIPLGAKTALRRAPAMRDASVDLRFHTGNETRRNPNFLVPLRK